MNRLAAEHPEDDRYQTLEGQREVLVEREDYDDSARTVIQTIKIPNRERRLEIKLHRRAIRYRIWAAFRWNPRAWRRRYLTLTAIDRQVRRDLQRAILFGEYP